MMQRAFFAIEDTRTPFKFTAIQIALHIIGSITISLTVEPQWVVVALSLLTSFTVTVQAIIAFRWLGQSIGSFKTFKIARAMVAYCVSAALAGAVGFAVLELLGGIRENSFVVDTVLSSVLSAAITGFVMLAVYLIGLRLLRVQELEPILKKLKNILRPNPRE
jgi:putative peptidoglycan lipid II flippase